MYNCVNCHSPVITTNDDSGIKHADDNSIADGITSRGNCNRERVRSQPITSAATIAPEHLESGANTYRERNKEYGDSYHKFGQVMRNLFPEGLTIDGSIAWNRLGVLSQIVGKICRYSNDFHNPQKDSIHDIMVYAAMLLELDDE